ncbi:MAG: DUF2628 domain-containing protein [Clostridia bacterium]|nr:DUF2628 domain-containing protein [Clostridia bacterium]
MSSCPQCSTDNHYVAKKCRNCGTKLNTAEYNPGESSNPEESVRLGNQNNPEESIDLGNQNKPGESPVELMLAEREELRLFVGNNAEYYLQRWDTMIRTGSLVSWNWAAFLLSPAWLFYRKMYLSGIIYLVATVLLKSYIIPIVIISIGIGTAGNFIYMKHARGRILAIKSVFHVPDNQKKIIAKNGGISWGSVMVLLIIFAMVITFRVARDLGHFFG